MIGCVDDSPVDMSEQLYEPLAPQPTPPPIDPNAVAYAIPPHVMSPYGYLPYAHGYYPPPKPRVWTGFTAFGIYIVVTLVFGVAVIVAQSVITGSMDLNTELVLGILGFNVIIAGAVAALGARLSSEPLLDRLQLRVAKMSVFSTLLGILTTCAIGLFFTAGFALVAKIPELSSALDTSDLLSGLGPHQPGLLALGYLVIAGGAGIGEELLFRGYMQSRFVKRMGFYGALFTTAGLFGLAHANLVQTPFAFVMGLYVGHLAYRTGSIWPAILAHTANNAMAVTMTVFGFIPNETGTLWLLLLVAFAFTVIGWLVTIVITPRATPAVG